MGEQESEKEGGRRQQRGRKRGRQVREERRKLLFCWEEMLEYSRVTFRPAGVGSSIRRTIEVLMLDFNRDLFLL